jgi:hypothetical protein
VRKRSFVKAGKRSSNGLLLGYARVSKGDDQTNIMQARALRATGCRRIFEEAVRRLVQSCTACSTTCAKATHWWSGSWTACRAR